MIIKARIRLFKGTELLKELVKDVKVENCWFTCQKYFNRSFKKKLLDAKDGLDTITIGWDGKNYEFTTRIINDDSSHEEGRKKRSPQHRKAA